MAATMKDVASRAGVSISAVSIVLHDKPGVSRLTRENVLRAVQELGYQLPGQRSSAWAHPMRTIAVVHYAPLCAPISYSSGLPSRYLSGIQSYASEQGLSLTVVANYGEDDEQNVGHEILEGEGARFDGLILIMCPVQERRLLGQALAREVPVVAIGSGWRDLPISWVGPDYGRQAWLALEHLEGVGHRRIAFLGSTSDRGYDWYEARLAAHRAALEQLDGWDGELVAEGDDPGAAAVELVRRRPDVTAVYGASDASAYGALRALIGAGIGVPGEISVIGLDDALPPEYGGPGLTTVGLPRERVGYEAAKVLHEQLLDRDLAYSRTYLRSWLVLRESTAAPRGDRLSLLSGCNLAANILTTVAA